MNDGSSPASLDSDDMQRLREGDDLALNDAGSNRLSGTFTDLPKTRLTRWIWRRKPSSASISIDRNTTAVRRFPPGSTPSRPIFAATTLAGKCVTRPYRWNSNHFPIPRSATDYLAQIQPLAKTPLPANLALPLPQLSLNCRPTSAPPPFCKTTTHCLTLRSPPSSAAPLKPSKANSTALDSLYANASPHGWALRFRSEKVRRIDMTLI